MGFDKADLLRCNSRIRARFPHQARLRRRVRQRNAVGMSVLIDCRAENDALDRVAIRDCLGKPLEQHHARAFATHKSTGRCIKGGATPLGREHPSLRKTDEPSRRDHDGHTPGQSRIAATRPNMLARRMHGRERRGTGRVHGHTRAVQIQAIRDAVCGNAVRTPGWGVRADAGMIESVALNALVVVVRNSDKDREIGSALEIEHDTGVLDRLPRRFKKQPVLRVDIRSFPGRNAKELRIELIDAFNKAAAPDDRLAGQTRLRVIVSLNVPPIRRHLDDAFPAFDEKFPKRFLVVYAAGKPATDSNDRNTLFLHNRNGPRRGELISVQACVSVKVGLPVRTERSVTLSGGGHIQPIVQIYSFATCRTRPSFRVFCAPSETESPIPRMLIS